MRLSLVFRLAWAEIARRRAEHFVYVLVIAVGVASLISTSSFTESLGLAIEQKTKTLLGADIVVKSRSKLEDKSLEKFNSQAVAFSDQVSFNSMLQVVDTGDTRLVQVRAVSGGAPYYGEFETVPLGARSKLDSWQSSTQLPPAIVDSSLLYQFNLSVGKVIQLGKQQFVIVAELLQVAGESALASTVGPRVYIPDRAIENTELLTVGSLARYQRFYLQPEPLLSKQLAASLKQTFAESTVRIETVSDRKSDLKRILGNISIFMGVAGMTALLLGLAGVASASFVQARQKRRSVATLRCLGFQSSDVSKIYAFQSILLSTVGSAFGAIIGWGMLLLFPLVVGEFIPFDEDLNFYVSFWTLVAGLFVGVFGGLLFSWEALRGLSEVSPMAALRVSLRDNTRPLSVQSVSLIVPFLLFAGYFATGGLVSSLVFLLSIAVIFALIRLLSYWLLRLLKVRLLRVPSSLLRQGFGNVYRQNSQASVMLLSLALLSFVISLTLILQQSLLDEVRLKSTDGQPNIIFFDIQSDQLEELTGILEESKLPIIEKAPIVTMRLREVDGKPLSELKKNKKIPGWVLSREYRSTYRSGLNETENIVEGDFVGSLESLGEEPIPVSFEESLCEYLEIGIGSRVEFDVQGVTLSTVVSSIRAVDWKQVRPNFYVVFPSGVLESAPQTSVLASRISSAEESAAIQRLAVERLPNVSVIDITLILGTLTSVIDKISFVLLFLGLFIVVMGAVVLGGALAAGKYQRVKEMLIYRLLGAGSSDLKTILYAELGLVGVTGIAVGVFLAVVAAGILTTFVLEVTLSGVIFGVVVSSVVCFIMLTLLGSLAVGPFKNIAPRDILR